MVGREAGRYALPPLNPVVGSGAELVVANAFQERIPFTLSERQRAAVRVLRVPHLDVLPDGDFEAVSAPDAPVGKGRLLECSLHANLLVCTGLEFKSLCDPVRC